MCLKNSKTNRRVWIVWISLSCAVVLAASTALAFYFLYLPKKYSQFVERYAAECGLDSDLVYAVIRCESGFDEDAMSRSGAIGLMQLRPETANYISRLAGKEHAPDLYDAESNIRTGVLYLVYLRQRFSTLSEILAAYNAGEGRVNAWLCDPRYSDNGETLTDIPFQETRQYVKRVKKFYNYYKFFYF